MNAEEALTEQAQEFYQREFDTDISDWNKNANLTRAMVIKLIVKFYKLRSKEAE